MIKNLFLTRITVFIGSRFGPYILDNYGEYTFNKNDSTEKSHKEFNIFVRTELDTIEVMILMLLNFKMNSVEKQMRVLIWV